MAEVKKEHRELAANICFTRPLGSAVESFVAGDRVTYNEGSLFACMVAFAQAIADTEERGRRTGRADAFAEAHEYCHGYFNYPELLMWLDEKERAVLDGKE